MRIKIYFEIFLAYKFQKSGNHLEKEPSACIKGNIYELGTYWAHMPHFISSL